MGLYPVFAFYEDKPRFEKKRFHEFIKFRNFQGFFFFFLFKMSRSYIKFSSLILNLRDKNYAKGKK